MSFGIEKARAFLDELEKMAVELNRREQAKQVGQFTALGAVARPAVSMLSNRIESGSFLPAANKGRWLAARAVGGAVLGGALPVVRHHLEQRNLAQAKARSRAGG